MMKTATQGKRYEKIRDKEHIMHGRKVSAEAKCIEMYYSVKHLVARVNYDFNVHGKDFDDYMEVRAEKVPYLEQQREASDQQQRAVYHFYDMAAAARSKGQPRKAENFVAKAMRAKENRDVHLDNADQAAYEIETAMKKARKGSPMANLSKLIRAVFVWHRAERKLRYYEAKEARLSAKKAKMAARLDAHLEAEAADKEQNVPIVDIVTASAPTA